VTGDTLKPNPPDRLYSAVVASNVLVLNVLVHIVIQLKKLRFVFKSDAILAQIEVWQAL
jgi:hypothetical protein